MLQGEMAGQTSDTLNLRARVGLGVEREPITGVFLTIAEVDTASQFTNDVEVNAAADLGLEWRDVDEGGSSEAAGPEVSECAHFFAEFEDALFGADGAVAPFLSYHVSACYLPPRCDDV